MNQTTQLSRKEFLKTLSAGMIGLWLLPSRLTASVQESPSTGSSRETHTRKRYGMLVDLDRCIGCQSCTVSCKTENNIPAGYFRTWVKTVEKGRFPHVSRHYLPRLCNHCDQPPCVDVCPVLATYKRSDGAVVIDQDRCIGCGYCVQACPYDARFINPVTHRADKCTFCIHRVEAGLEPACVTTCIGGARIFGDLNDPTSQIAQRVATEPTQVLRPDFGTEPMVFYVGLDKDIEGRIEEQG